MGAACSSIACPGAEQKALNPRPGPGILQVRDIHSRVKKPPYRALAQINGLSCGSRLVVRHLASIFQPQASPIPEHLGSDKEVLA